MCTLVILRRPGHPWPLLLAANRDEMRDRPWRPPSRHWPERPQVVAGLDELGGGSWLGLNDAGVVAGVLNRVGSLGPAATKRSRGELVLLALEHGDAGAAARRLAGLEAARYRSFNLVVADRDNAYWLRNLGEEGEAAAARIELFELPPGLSMITARDRNDVASPRIRANLVRFAAADAPDPAAGTWSSWQAILASREAPAGGGPEAAMTVVTESGFETVSSSLLALPGPASSASDPPGKPVWLFAPGRPDLAEFAPVAL